MSLDLIASSTQAASKAYRCEECGFIIEPKQRYVRERYADGGDTWVWRAHEECDLAAKSYLDHMWKIDRHYYSDGWFGFATASGECSDEENYILKFLRSDTRFRKARERMIARKMKWREERRIIDKVGKYAPPKDT